MTSLTRHSHLQSLERLFPQKPMVFSKSVIPFPPMQLDPGSCQAVRIAAILDKPINRVEGSPEWRAEQEAKQRYEKDRQAHYERVGIKKL